MRRALALVLAGTLDAVLAVPLLAGSDVRWIHPLAPPLNRIDALGDRTLGPETRPPPLAEAPRLPELMAEAARARVKVEEDALVMASVLGPDRVGRMVAARETLSEAVGEGAAWDRAIEALVR